MNKQAIKETLNGIELGKKLAVYVPSTLNAWAGEKKISIPITPRSHELIARLVMREFAAQFGGVTAHHAKGAWINKGGNMIQENVIVVYSYTNHINHDAIRFLKDVAENLCSDTWLNQDCVTVEVDNTAYLIENPFSDEERKEWS